MESLIALADEEPEFVSLLLELVESVSRIEFARWIRLLEEETTEALRVRRVA